MFAAHHGLSNLVAVVDLNGQQALGYTKDVLDLSPMADRWRAFGWDVHEVDGHDPVALADTIRGSTPRQARRTCSSRTPSSARVSRSWRAASSGTTFR